MMATIVIILLINHVNININMNTILCGYHYYHVDSL